MRYLNYFDQIILQDFIPITKPLILCKIIITFEEVSPKKSKRSKQEDSEILEEPLVFDYQKMLKNLFIRIFSDDETLLFDQLDQSLRNND